MTDHRETMVYADGFDEATESHYVVTVSLSESHSAVKINVREVSLDIDYHFSVAPNRNLPIAETTPPGFRWAHPCGISELQERITLVLENARIPLAARNYTVRMIFEKLVTENWLMNSSVGYIFGVNLRTDTSFDYYKPSDEVDQDGYDEATGWMYDVTVSRWEDQSEASLAVNYVFHQNSEREDSPVVEAFPQGGRWRLQDGLEGLKEEITRVLNSACIPLEARKTTIELIFDNFVTQSWFNSTSVGYVGVKLETKMNYYVPNQPELDGGEYRIHNVDLENEVAEDGFEGGFGRVLEESMEEDYLREMPARREAVEELERFRVRGGERETTCVVCLDGFSLGIEVVKMPCSHVFHGDCIVRWLQCRCFCPLCKFKLPYGEDEPMERNPDFGIEEDEPMEENSDFGMEEAIQDFMDFLGGGNERRFG